MKRLIIGLFVGLLGGAVIGFGAGIFIYPFWFLNDVAEETLATGVERNRIAGGEFIDVNPTDPVHWGAGMVALYQEDSTGTVPGGVVVHLQEDFEVGPGPRFHVYLVDKEVIDSRESFLESDRVDLGRLRAFRGSQIYPVPADVDTANYKSVVIWCKEFDVLISPASLAPGNPKIANLD